MALVLVSVGAQILAWAAPPIEDNPGAAHYELALPGHSDRPPFLQILALEYPTSVWFYFPRGLRNFPRHGYPREWVTQLALQHHAKEIFLN